jgi:hypothetical protein
MASPKKSVSATPLGDKILNASALGNVFFAPSHTSPSTNALYAETFSPIPGTTLTQIVEKASQNVAPKPFPRSEKALDDSALSKFYALSDTLLSTY